MARRSDPTYRLILAALAGFIPLAVSTAPSQALAAKRFAVAPARLVVRASWFPGLAEAHGTLATSISASGWSFGILEDNPANGRQETARLKHEGFQEGVRLLLAASNGEAFSGALLFRSPRSARIETAIKADEEQAELGSGTVRSPVPAIPGAIELSQHRSAGELQPSEYESSIVFAVGRCTFGVGLALTPPAPLSAVEQATLAAARHLAHAVRAVCA